VRNGVVMDQFILFRKPNKNLESEMVMDHIIPPTKHPINGTRKLILETRMPF